MLKKMIILIVWVFVSQFLGSIEFEEILNSNFYYAGLGTSDTYEKANKKALQDLVTRISISVEVNYENVYSERDGNIEEFTKSMVSTYSNTMLTNTISKVKEDKETGEVTVIRYVERDNLEEVFKARAVKIEDYFKTGIKAEQELRIGDALRYYYWSLILLRSHPDNNKMKTIINDEEITLITNIPNRIETIFSSLQFSVLQNQLDKNHRAITLTMNLNGKPVENIDISYYTGDSWSSIISCNNGMAILDFYDSFAREMENFDIKVDFTHYNKRNIDSEISQMLEDLDNPSFRESRKTILLTKREKEEQIHQMEMEEILFNESLQAITPDNLISEIIKTIKNPEEKVSPDNFTKEGWQQFEKIIQYGNARIIGGRNNFFTLKSDNETTIRSIPVQFSFPNNNRNFSENLNFVINQDGKIKAVNLALSETAVEDILNHPEAWGTEENKYQIIQFMEYYKTAYCLKNLEFIQNIFSDNALIIIGNVLKQDKPIENMYENLRNIEYVRLSKQEYIERLENVFNSNEFVNISFEDNTIKKVNGEDKIYGIQIAQNYWSSSYADKGYLFLMIDLNDPDEPRIYVRSWQPEKNPDGSIIGLSDFQLY